MPAPAAFGAYAVQGLARFTEWVLRISEPATQRPREAAIVVDHQDPGSPPGQPPHVRRTASARGALGSGDRLLSSHGGQADAQSADCAQGDPAIPSNDRLAQYEGSPTQLGQTVLQGGA